MRVTIISVVYQNGEVYQIMLSFQKFAIKLFGNIKEQNVEQ